MSPRIRWLLVAGVAVFGLYGIDSLYRGWIEQPHQQIKAELDDLSSKLNTAKSEQRTAQKQGKQLVDEQVEAANSQIDSVKDNVKDRVAEVKGKVEGQFEKVEKAFDRRVASGLNRLGIPSKQDVDALSAKLDVLNAMLERAAKAQ